MEKNKKRSVKDENYYQITGWMVNPDKLNLSGLELQVYAIIFGFSQARDNCYHNGTNYLAEFTGATDRGVRKAIKSLINKGLLIERKESYQKYSYIAVVPDFDEYSSAQSKKEKNDELSSADGELSSANGELSSANDELSSADGELSSADGELSSTHNNIYNNNNYIYTDNQTNKSSPFLSFPELPHVKITLAELRFLNRYYEQKDVNRAMLRLESYIADTGHTFKSDFEIIEKWINEDMAKSD